VRPALQKALTCYFMGRSMFPAGRAGLRPRKPHVETGLSPGGNFLSRMTWGGPVPACLPACPPACLPARPPACLPAWGFSIMQNSAVVFTQGMKSCDRYSTSRGGERRRRTPPPQPPCVSLLHLSADLEECSPRGSSLKSAR